MKLVKNGLYSDVLVIFNNKKYKLHMELLKLVSKYFDTLDKNLFVDKSEITIIFHTLNNELLDTKYFDFFVDGIYEDNFNVTLLFNNSEIFDVIEYYRLLDYLSYNGTNNYKLSEEIKKKLDMYKPLKNTYDEILNEYINKKPYYKHSYFTQYTYDENQFSGLKKPSEIGLGRNIYKTITNLTSDYVLYIFKFLDNEMYRKKLLAISNIKLNDIYKFDEKYHKNILQNILDK